MRKLLNVSVCLAFALTSACSAESTSSGQRGPSGGSSATGGAAATGGGGSGDLGNDGTTKPPVRPRPAGEDAPADGACASVRVEATVDVKPGNLLLIFDRSLTMGDPFDTPTGPQPKYVAAGEALLKAVAPFACPSPADPNMPCTNTMTVGAIVFPTLITCSVDPIESPEQLNFQPAGDFITSWATYWTTRVLTFSTPFNAAFMQGDVALHRPDLVGNKAVVMFTDGDPFCDDGLIAPQLAAKWLTEGIKTYVVGLPGAAGVAILQNIAVAGGTNKYIEPADSVALEAELKKIAIETAGFESCTFTIKGRIVNKDKACASGKVSLDGTEIPCEPTNGFTIDDETHITFQGSSCDTLLESAGKLDATFPCEALVVE